MPATVPCPDANVLKRLQQSRATLGDVNTLEDHLLACKRCAETVGALSAGDPLTAAARAGAIVADDADRTRMQVLIERLRELGPFPASKEVDFGQDAPVYDFLAPPERADEIGRLGSYRVLGVLGNGGMGVVFRAEDPQLRRPVALKVLRPEIATKATARQRFLREGQTAAALEHDHVVTILQVGEAPTEQGSVPFLAMPLLKGESLQDRLEREGALPLAEVVRIGRQIAVALAAAHERSLIHRDIKPANVWLEAPGGRVKLLDFGIARPIVDDAHLTQEGHAPGTPHYMAPEQAEGKAVDHRSDLFSLGCVLYRMTTGRLPFPGANTISVLRALVAVRPTPPRQLNADVPAALSGLTMQLLATDRDARPQTAAVVAKRLAAIERLGHGTAAPARSSRLLAAAAIFIGLALVSALVWYSVTANYRTAPGAVSHTQTMARVEDERTGFVRDLWGHDGPIHGVAFLPDGIHAVSCSEDHTVRLWDTRAGHEVSRFFGHTSGVRDVAVTPDGKRILTAGGRDSTVRLWDVAEGRELHSTTLSGTANAVAISADGTKGLFADYLGPVEVWDIVEWKKLTVLNHKAKRASVCFLPDGRHAICVGPEASVRAWDLNKPIEIRSFQAHPKGMFKTICTKDGNYVLACGNEGDVRMWIAATGKEHCRFVGHTGPVAGLAVSDDGKRVVTAGTDRTVRLWDAQTGKQLHAFTGHASYANSVAISPDGRLALSGGSDRALKLWRLPPP